MGLFSRKTKEQDNVPKVDEVNNEEFVYDPANSQISVAIVRVMSKMSNDEKSKFRTFFKLQTFDKNIEVNSKTPLKSELVFMEVTDSNGESIKEDDPKIIALNESYKEQCKELNELVNNQNVSDKVKRAILSQRLATILKLHDTDILSNDVKLELTKDGKKLVGNIKNPEFKDNEANIDENGDKIFPIDIQDEIKMKKSIIVNPITFEIIEKSSLIDEAKKSWEENAEKWPPENIRPEHLFVPSSKSNSRNVPENGVKDLS